MAAWFADGSVGVSAPMRTDDYLLLPGCSTTSVKLREGRFEVKVITGEAASVGWSDQVAGKRDTWVKWSRKISDPDALRELTGGDDATWLPVSKQRDLRLVSLDGAAPAEIEPNTARLVNGCQFELTRIVLGGRGREEPWWSCSFEAFGQPPSVLRNLESGMEFVFRAPPPLPLPEDRSMSYPYWLMQCTQHS